MKFQSVCFKYHIRFCNTKVFSNCNKLFFRLKLFKILPCWWAVHMFFFFVQINSSCSWIIATFAFLLFISHFIEILAFKFFSIAELVFKFFSHFLFFISCLLSSITNTIIFSHPNGYFIIIDSITADLQTCTANILWKATTS